MEEELSNDRLVEVFVANDEAHAAIIKGRLESEGIVCFSETNRLVPLVPVSIGRLSEIKILVGIDDAEKAGEILASAEEGVDQP